MQATASSPPQENVHRPRCPRSTQKIVTQALRDAYRRHVRDPLTRQAVKLTLGS